MEMQQEYLQPCPMLKKELAQILQMKWQTLRSRIMKPEILSELEAVGYTPRIRMLTERQVSIIFSKLGPVPATLENRKLYNLIQVHNFL